MTATIRDDRKILLVLRCLLWGALMASCGESVPEDPAEYAAFIADPERGLLKEKSVGDMRFAVKYQPAEYLAMKDANGEQGRYRSLLHRYANGMSFTIQVDAKEEDVMGRGVGSYDDYRERVALLNFGIKDYVQLKTSDTTLAPVLGTMENTYGLVPGRTLLVVFQANAAQILEGKEGFEIIFADPVFGTGVNRFHYRAEDILKAPIPNV